MLQITIVNHVKHRLRIAYPTSVVISVTYAKKRQCEPGDEKRCFDCGRLCQSIECFTAHKALTGQQTISICDRVSKLLT